MQSDWQGQKIQPEGKLVKERKGLGRDARGLLVLNQSARDSYTQAATLTRSASAIRSTAAVTAGAS
jgi:hypothetical protein